MKIALLNLPVDNNYGGMLQRYALIKVLEDMGHEVKHLNLRMPYNSSPLGKRLLRDIKRIVKLLCGKYKGPILPERSDKMKYLKSCKVTDQFYEKYIRHTRQITDKSSLRKASESADVLLIGSDQVWRKIYGGHYGIGTYFGDFLPLDSSIKRVAYGASFGVANDEYSESDKHRLRPYFQSFSAVSVREDSGLKLLADWGWDHPAAEQVLDPTLLLFAKDYSILIDKAKTEALPGNMCCYILDPTEEKISIIEGLVAKRHLTPFYLSIDGKVSVEQWLRSFRDAEYVVTDSYHGLVFSIIMKKPFYLFNNTERGNARFDSLLNLLKIRNTEVSDWSRISVELEKQRRLSLSYLKISIH